MRPTPQAKVVVVRAAAVESVRRGHPWVWSQGILSVPPELASGDEVVLASNEGAWIGRGVFEAGSPIAARVWSTDGERPLDADHVREKLRDAFEKRQELATEGTTALRLLHGEGDRMPGLVIDRYGDVAVLRFDGAGAEGAAIRMKDILVEGLTRIHLRDIVVRHSEKGSRPTFDVWVGSMPDAPVTVREHGVPFVVDLRHGQKTGAFLDQRENRRRVGAMAKGKTLLNLFSYTGGFSLHAAAAGATQVTSVDIAPNAHSTAQASFRAAGVDARGHEFVTADVFAFLSRAKELGHAWDIVVSDPPSFAPNKKSVARALTAYRALHRAAVQVLTKGGTLCAASCSSHVDAEMFLTTLDDAALAPRRLALRELHGPPADHPTLAGWPEGRYLKLAILS
jgi:23S rRNA (cytosine1962-C5)-methyltransferase